VVKGAEVEFSWQNKLVRIQGVSDTDWIYSSIKKTGTFYEIDLLKYIRYAMENRHGCILDAGANIGNHSVFFGMFVSDAVVCFEPNASVLPTLVANLSENRINSKVYQLGLGEREAVADIELPGFCEDNIGMARLVEKQTGVGQLIRVATLDSLLPEIKTFMDSLTVLAIKIDVEGMELSVLRGGMTVLDEYKPDLFIEVLNDEQMGKIESILIPMGYKRIISWASTPVWHFMHRDRLSLMRMLRLFAYISLHKFAIYLGRIYRRFGLLFE